jgi:hypothetical protein
VAPSSLKFLDAPRNNHLRLSLNFMTMPEAKEEPPTALPTVEVAEVPFSRLEASLAKAEIAPRPNSREMKDVYRHAQPSDMDVNELDFDFSLDSSHYPLGSLRSLQQVFDAVQHETHLSNHKNFSDQTLIECLEVSESDGAGKGLLK